MRLKEARARRYLSMRELATKAGVSLATIRDVESGRTVPRLGTARKLAQALEMDPDEVDEFRVAVQRTIGMITPPRENP